jgi:cytochrome c556
MQMFICINANNITHMCDEICTQQWQIVCAIRRACGFHGGLLMIRSAMMIFVAVAGASSVLAQAADPIAARKDVLKGFGAAAREPGQMLRGEAPFDLAKAQNLMRVLSAGSKTLPGLFPDSSKTGDTKALPAIWEKKADFDAIFVKMGADAEAALVAMKDEASFKAEMPKVLGNCGTCHNTYRAK